MTQAAPEPSLKDLVSYSRNLPTTDLPVEGGNQLLHRNIKVSERSTATGRDLIMVGQQFAQTVSKLILNFESGN